MEGMADGHQPSRGFHPYFSANKYKRVADYHAKMWRKWEAAAWRPRRAGRKRPARAGMNSVGRQQIKGYVKFEFWRKHLRPQSPMM